MCGEEIPLKKYTHVHRKLARATRLAVNPIYFVGILSLAKLVLRRQSAEQRLHTLIAEKCDKLPADILGANIHDGNKRK